MSSGSLVVTSSFTEASSSSVTSATKTNDNENRLAPFSPTHDTAQSKALDLLKLTSHDVFFDLGCGDGRLIIAALERCYDDDYLMRVHQERFARLQLHREEESPGASSHPHSSQNNSTPRQNVHKRTGSELMGSGTTTSSARQIHHSKSHSTDFSVPHLMMSNDDVSEDTSAFDINSPPYKIPHMLDNSDKNSVGASLASAPEQQHSKNAMPNSPTTPIACNRGGVRRLNVGVSCDPPTLPHSLAAGGSNATPNNNNTNYNRGDSDLHTPNEGEELLCNNSASSGIPKLIETPSPNSGKTHAPQISELPMTESLVDQLADIGLASIPSGDVFDVPGGNHEHAHGGGGVVAVAGAGVSVGGLLGGGLQCVGIEYNQALAESAQANVQKSYIYPHVERKVCIRWGDVLDEWNRGSEGGKEGSGNNNEGNGNNSRASWSGDDSEDLQEREPTSIQGEHQDGGDGDARNLTLLNDATAVFVYLLPQGLKKVKPLLYEAAMLRYQKQEQQRIQRQEQILQDEAHHLQKQKLAVQKGHPLHNHPLQQHSLPEKEDPYTTGGGDSSYPFPPRQLIHRKGYSHVSELTCDYGDFRSSSKSLEEMDRGNNNLQGIEEHINHPPLVGGAGNNSGVRHGGQMTQTAAFSSRNNVIIPTFRVVSYMFSIPGWTPTEVDRSSKGGCPVYLYENIHNEEK